MKKLTLLLLAALLMSGCEWDWDLTKDFKKEHPGAVVKPVDKDGDGIIDTYMADLDGDGTFEVEVAKAGAALEAAGSVDEFVGELVTWLTGIFGLGTIGGLIGARIVKSKFGKQLLYWKQSFADVVGSVEDYRGTLPPDQKAVMNNVLGSAQSKETKGEVAKAKAGT